MSDAKQWFVLYTKPRWEKKIDLSLKKKSIETWCPLQKKEHQWSDRKKVVETPIFKSYIFVRINESERIQVLQTAGIVNFVHYLGKPAVIRDKEIELIKSYYLQQDADFSLLSIDSFAKDMQVRIKQGVFMDHEGVIARKPNKRKVYIYLRYLEQVLLVEFPVEFVEKV